MMKEISMRYLFTSLILISIFISYSFAQTRTTIAVMELGAAGVAETDAQVITSRLRTDLFNTKKYIVLERDKVNEVLKEQGFQRSMCTTNECVVEVGKLIGVQQMVAGEIGKVGNLYTITIRLIDVESGKVLKTATEDCRCEIETVLTQSVKNVAEILAGNKIQTDTYTTSQKQSINFSDTGLTEWEMKGMTRDEFVNFKRSGLSEAKWIKYNNEKKGAITQVLKSFLFPGWGQLSLDRKRGYTYIIIDALALSGIIYSYAQKSSLNDEYNYWLSIERDSGDEDATRKAVSAAADVKFYMNLIRYFFYGLFGNRIISSIDAGYTTPTYNEELKKKYKLSFAPKLNRYSKQPMLGLNVNF